MTAPTSVVDVAVIGGGTAGLAATLALVRARKRVTLFDAWPPRNAAATEVRGFVTQDGTPPAELRRVARAQLAAYPTCELRDDDPVRDVRGASGDFSVESGGGVIRARRVLLCVGLVDVLPALPGYRELWGTSLFQCPHCHAWEVRDRAFGYLARDAECADWAVLLRAWTRDLIVFTDARFELPPPLRAELATAGVAVETRQVVGLVGGPEGLRAVALDGGAEIARDVLFVRPPQRQTALVAQLVARLGLRLDAPDRVHADDRGETSITGLFAAGDLVLHEHGALAAGAHGARVAHALDEQLTRELVLSGAW